MATIGTPKHELKKPILYYVQHLRVWARLNNQTEGMIVFVLTDLHGNVEAVDSSDTFNLTRMLGYEGVKLAGRGVLIEKLTSDEWFVAWRSFSPVPEFVPWKG